MQTARNLVGVAAELAAGVQHGHDHFQSGLVRIFRMGIDGNAAAVVGHGYRIVGVQRQFDPVGKTGHRFVH